MTWTLLISLLLALGIALLARLARRAELARTQESLAARDVAEREGAGQRKLQHPIVDLSRCMGCATCVAVCPEDHVLEIAHGQALVVEASRCIGVAACERECPVGAITVTIAELESRDDVPVLDEGLEAVGRPGVFLAGEVTAHALIRTAVEHGTRVARAAAARRAQEPAPGDALDLVIVGSGPAGLAASLEATRLGLDFVTLERSDEIGGTVAKYPRRKLVLTEPVELPLYGRMKQRSYQKEELIRLWRRLAREHALPIHTGQDFRALCDDEGAYLVETETHSYRARCVCFAIGRRGTPRTLGVPGEELPHVAYGLIDAASYAGRRALVVGAGDTAVEAALALAEQPGTQVTLANRGSGFPRIRSRNRNKLDEALARGALEVAYEAEVRAIHAEHVELRVASLAATGVGDDTRSAQGLARSLEHLPDNEARGATHVADDASQGAEHLPDDAALGTLHAPYDASRSGEHLPGDAARGAPNFAYDASRGAEQLAGDAPHTTTRLPIDDVFVLIGGTAPFAMLRDAGVSFDASLRAPAAPLVEEGTGLTRALAAAFALAFATLCWALYHVDYYGLALHERPAHPSHASLRPGLGLGLAFGIGATVLVLVNLLYLARRSPRVPFHWGSLQLWMTSHIATGVLALLLTALHAGLAPKHSSGGHAFWALAVLLATGAIGRYFYSYIPRAANGRELELFEVRGQLASLAAAWGDSAFARFASARIDELARARQWDSSFVGRVLATMRIRFDLRRARRELRAKGEELGASPEQLRETLGLAERAHRLASSAAGYEDLRALMNTWRWIHRWGAALMLVLLGIHIAHAVLYGSIL